MVNKGDSPLSKEERIELDNLREQHKKVIEKARAKSGVQDKAQHSSDDSEEEYLDEAKDLLSPVTQ